MRPPSAAGPAPVDARQLPSPSQCFALNPFLPLFVCWRQGWARSSSVWWMTAWPTVFTMCGQASTRLARPNAFVPYRQYCASLAARTAQSTSAPQGGTTCPSIVLCPSVAISKAGVAVMRPLMPSAACGRGDTPHSCSTSCRSQRGQPAAAQPWFCPVSSAAGIQRGKRSASRVSLPYGLPKLMLQPSRVCFDTGPPAFLAAYLGPTPSAAGLESCNSSPSMMLVLFDRLRLQKAVCAAKSVPRITYVERCVHLETWLANPEGGGHAW